MLFLIKSPLRACREVVLAVDAREVMGGDRPGALRVFRIVFDKRT